MASARGVTDRTWPSGSYSTARHSGSSMPIARIHGYGVAVSSWSTVRSGRRWDYRLDHVLTRGGLTPVTARYRQELRESVEGLPRLSDHAAIEVTLTISDDGAR